MKTQKFLLAFTLFFTLGIGFVSAWNGLVASPGDILNASKWNELVDKINPLYSVGGTGGSVGVGDSTPDHKLDVAGNIGLNTSSYINFGDTTGSTGYGFRDNAGTIQFKNNAGSWISIPTVGGGGNDDLGNHTAIQNIALDTFWLSGDGDDEGIIIDIDGNVGVGEPTPTGKLHITNTYTDTSNATIVASSSIPGINLRTTSSGRFSIFSNYNTANTTSILTSTGTSNPLNVITLFDHVNNRVSIGGDTTPDHTLDVNGNIGLTASSYINFGDTTGTSGYGIRDNAGAIEFKNNAGAWTALPTSSGIGTLNTLTASSQTFATGSTGADFNFSSAGSVHTLNIPSAGTTARGLVTTAAQSFAGTKTFTNDFLVNGLTTLGDAGADSLTINASTASIPNGLNFDTNTLFLDAANNRIGVGLGTTTAAVHIKAGTATASTAPLKFTSGINLTTPEAGAVEYNGTQLFFSPSATRNILAQISGGTAHTTGSIPFATTNGYLLQDNANFFWDDTSNELGILTNAPNTKLDINGDISLRLGTDYATSGSTNDVALGGGSSSTARYTGAANGTITGITGGQNGKILNIMNASNFLFTLSNESTSSTTTNRIITGNGQDVTLSPGQATILQYDSTATRWRMLDGSPKRYVYRVTSAQTNVGTTTNYTTITGMTTGTLPIGAYKFELVTKFRSNNTTSGMGLALSNGTAVTSNFNARFEAQIATNGAAAFYHATVGAAGTTIASTAVLSTAIDYYSELRGTFQVTTAGTMNAQFRSEVNPRTTTIQPGSYMIIEPLY